MHIAALLHCSFLLLLLIFCFLATLSSDRHPPLPPLPLLLASFFAFFIHIIAAIPRSAISKQPTWRTQSSTAQYVSTLSSGIRQSARQTIRGLSPNCPSFHMSALIRYAAHAYTECMLWRSLEGITGQIVRERSGSSAPRATKRQHSTHSK